MKRKIETYLCYKEKSEYNYLDKIFELYLNGNLKKLLSNYLGVIIDPTINKLGRTIQINYNFYNICVSIDFFEDKYYLAIYPEGTSVGEFENFLEEYDFQPDFDLEYLIKEIDGRIKSHPKLQRIALNGINKNHSKLKNITLKEKRKRIYQIIALACWILPLVICGIMLLFRLKFNKELLEIYIVSSFVIGLTLDIKSVRQE